MEQATQQPRTGILEGSAASGGAARLLLSLRALGGARLAALALVGLLTFGLIGAMVLRGSDTPMGLLYADLDQRDAAQIVQALEQARVPFRLEAGGSRVMAPEERIPRLRLMLARDGLPSGGSVGYEIFDRSGGLTTTPFQQDINRLRALEGELARSIRSLDGVTGARVHLALPRREPFSRERSEPQASVVLQMRGAQRLDREGVQAVVQLVAAAVPGLKPQHVSVVDGRGELLARGGEGADLAGRGQDEVRRAQELRLARNVEEMLERTLGPGRVRAEATIEMDLERVQTSEERFNPDNQVARSQSSVNETRRNGEPQNVSVANQLPGAPTAAASGAQNEEGRQEETTNFEIGRATRSTLREQPVVRRLSVAVLVDGVYEPGATPEAPAVFRERTPAELDRIRALVRGAVGFNEARGDQLEVVSLRFTDPSVGLAGEAGGRGFLGLPALTPTLTARLLESGLFAVVALVALLLVGRPVARRLVAGLNPAKPGEASPLAAGGPAALPAPEGSRPGAGEVGESMVDVAMIEGQIRVSSLNGLADLVERHPDETLAVVRRWLQPDEVKA